MNSRWTVLISLSIALASCGVKVDRFGRTAEPASLPEPVTLKEVSFHVRMRLPDAELVAQAARRGLIVDGDPQKALASVQAPPGLIAKLAIPGILLTKAERKLYEARLAARNSNRAADEASTQEFLDQRKADLNQSLAEQQRARLQQRVAELVEKAGRIRREQTREKYSLSSDSPYQRRQAEIDAINREISALNERAQ